MTTFDAGVPAQANAPARQTAERIGIHRITLFIVEPRQHLRKPAAGVTCRLEGVRSCGVVTTERRAALALPGEAVRTRCSNMTDE